MSTPSTFSFIKETTGGTTIIENGTEHFFGSNFSPHFKAKGNLLTVTVSDCEFKVLDTDTVHVNPGTGDSLFSGTISQLKAALIPVFPKVNTGSGGSGNFTPDEITTLKAIVAQQIPQ